MTKHTKIKLAKFYMLKMSKHNRRFCRLKIADHYFLWSAFYKSIAGIYFKRIKIFFFIHSFIIFSGGVVSTILAIQKYNDNENKQNFASKIRNFENNSNLLRSYYRYTGTETGFGFFAPDVRSHGVIFFQSCGSLLSLPFLTHEGNIRVICMVSSVTEYVSDELSDTNKKPTLKHTFSDLLIQNLVANVRLINNINKNCSTVQVDYKLLEFPPLNAKVKKRNPKLFEVKKWIYETKY